MPGPTVHFPNVTTVTHSQQVLAKERDSVEVEIVKETKKKLNHVGLHHVSESCSMVKINIKLGVLLATTGNYSNFF